MLILFKESVQLYECIVQFR